MRESWESAGSAVARREKSAGHEELPVRINKEDTKVLQKNNSDNFAS